MAKNKGVEAEQPKKTEGKEEPIFTHNQKVLIDSYRKALGSVSKAAQLSKLKRETFYYNLNNSPNFAEAIKSVDAELLREKLARTNEMLDVAEENLYYAITGQYTLKPKYDLKTGLVIPGEFECDAEGNPIRNYVVPISERLLIAFLEMKGKDRGYTKRTEHKIEGDMFSGMKINIVNKKPRG